MVYFQLIAALVALIYQGQTLTFVDIQNIQGALFIFLTNMTFQNVFGVVNVSMLSVILKLQRTITHTIFLGYHRRITNLFERAF